MKELKNEKKERWQLEKKYYCEVCKKEVYPIVYCFETDFEIHWEITCPNCGELLDED